MLKLFGRALATNDHAVWNRITRLKDLGEVASADACCGGPAAAQVDACCAEDAVANKSGDGGGGCAPAASLTAGRSCSGTAA